MSEKDRQIEENQRLLAAKESQRTSIPRARRSRSSGSVVEESGRSIQAEELRLKFESGARTIISNYQEEIATLNPQALKSVDEVIKPWWLRLQASGLLDRLPRFKDGNSRRTLSLNDPISYFRPTRLYKELQETEKPFWSRAKEVVTGAFNEGIGLVTTSEETIALEEGLLDEFEHMTSEQWTSKIYLPRDQAKYLGFSGLEIFSWPSEDAEYRLRHSRWGGQVMVKEPNNRRRERVSLNLGRSEVILPDVHPLVLIELADQIQTGRVWKRIQGSIRR